MKVDLIRAVIYGLKAPIVVCPGQEDLVPERLKDMATPIRLAKATECLEQEMATEFDALIYLHTVSVAVPMDLRWGTIYFWLFRRFFPDEADRIGLPEVELDSYHRELLNRLRAHIFKVQVKRLKANGGFGRPKRLGKPERTKPHRRLAATVPLTAFFR